MATESNHLDFEELLKHIEEHKAGYDKVAGKDIVFFLGYTGAGKTTTILYLSGMEIKEGVFSIEGKKIDDYYCTNGIPGFKIGYGAKSQTTIAALHCSSSGLTFVDFAGLDTSGPAIQIANIVGLFKTLTSARSVRLVFVVDARAIRVTKGQGFLECLHYLSGLIPNLSEKLGSFVVLYTHIQKLREVRKELEKHTDGVSQSELGALLTHLHNTVNETLIIDPLDTEKIELIIDLIKKAEPLVTTPDSYRFILPTNCERLLADQLEAELGSIKHHSQKYTWRNAVQHFKDLHLLYTQMPMVHIVVEKYTSGQTTARQAVEGLSMIVFKLLSEHKYSEASMKLASLKSSIAIYEYIKTEQFNLESILQDIAEEINRVVESAASTIASTESYIQAWEMLDRVKAISEHLSTDLTLQNRALLTTLENIFLSRIVQQYNEVQDQIQSFEIQGNYFVEAKFKHLTDLLAHNLGMLAVLQQLPITSMHYANATLALDKVLESHSNNFLTGHIKELLPEDLALSFKVLKDLSQAKLIAHVPKSQSLFPIVEKAFIELLGELNHQIGLNAVRYEFTSMPGKIARLLHLAKIDIECFNANIAEKWRHTKEQLQTLVTSAIEDISRKVAEEAYVNYTIAGCKYINTKMKLLEEVRPVECYFSDTPLASHFLSGIRAHFHLKATDILKLLEDSLDLSNLQKVKELCALLEVVPPEVMARFQAWTNNFRDNVQEAEKKIKQHIHISMYSELAVACKYLESLQRFIAAFLLCDHSEFKEFDTSTSTILTQIIVKVTTDWQNAFSQLSTIIKDATTLQTTSNKPENFKALRLMETMKAINDSNIEEHLTEAKPSIELPALTKQLKSTLAMVAQDTNFMIQMNQIESAEANLPIVNMLCAVVECMEATEGAPYATLANETRQKRLQLTQQIPDYLKANHFAEVADILKSMKAAPGIIERNEFAKSQLYVSNYFEEMVKQHRCGNVDSVKEAISTLYLLDKATILDKVAEFGIAAKRANLASKIQTFTTHTVQQFQKLLNERKFLEAQQAVSSFEALVAEFFGEDEFKNVINFRDKLAEQVQNLPQTVAKLDFSKYHNFSKVDQYITQLEQLHEKFAFDTDEVIGAIQEQVDSVVLEKDIRINDLISDLKIDQAKNELFLLKRVIGLKCVASCDVQAKVAARTEDIDCRRGDQFNRTELKGNPKNVSAELANVRQKHGHAEYNRKLAIIATQCQDMATSIGTDVERISIANYKTILPSLASSISIYQSIITAFSHQHKTFSDSLQEKLSETVPPKLDRVCTALQTSAEQYITTKEWQAAQRTLTVMERLGSELEVYVSKDFVQSIAAIAEQINATTKAITESSQYFKRLDLFADINIETALAHLNSLKENAPVAVQSESYESVVTAVLRYVEKCTQDVLSAWKDRKFATIPKFLANMQYSTPLQANHEALAQAFDKSFSQITTYIKNSNIELEEQAAQAIAQDKLTQLEELLIKYSEHFKHFAAFHAIFPQNKNELLKNICDSIDGKVTEFTTNCTRSPPDIHDAVKILLRLKQYTSQLSSTDLAAHIHTTTDNLLTFLLNKKNFKFFELGKELCASGTLGKELVEGDNFPQFKATVLARMNQRMANMTAEHALMKFAERNKIQDPSHLQAVFSRFNTHFEQGLQRYLLASTADLDRLVTKIQNQLNKKDWRNAKEFLPEVLAEICVVWSVSSSQEFYRESKDKDMVLKPHSIQVLTIICMLGLDTRDGIWSFAQHLFNKITSSTVAEQIKGRFAQIGTGEGKTIILGIISIVLALIGCEKVSCACYSPYLSRRDFDSFSGLFSRFGVHQQIQYSTIAQLAGTYINEQGDIREFTKKFIEGAATISHDIKPRRPRVLLIDEVDTFLSKDFYGATYNPCAILNDDNVIAILEFIWKQPNCNFNLVKGLEAFGALNAKYKDITRIIESAVHRMISEVKAVNNPPYFIVKNTAGQSEIGYEENGTISSSIHLGYRTCFAYLQARDKQLVTTEMAHKHLGLTINCGQFSYAEIPHEFDCIMGVTGTLETLSEFEKKVMTETYKITKQIFAPSIYGDSRRTFRHVEDVHVMSDTANYYLQLKHTILTHQQAMQPVLVFFEGDKELNAFAKSQYCTGLAHKVITESTENIQFYIRTATYILETSGLPSVSFLTRSFGRGIDFSCHDDKIERGVHVIQAFLSEDASEEIQIQGRTARQGKPGSFCLVLHAEDLAQRFAVTPAQIEERRHAGKLYEFLHATRVGIFAEKSELRKEAINRSFQQHTESNEYRSLFQQPRATVSNKIVKFLEVQNPLLKPKSKLVCLSDATGSMTKVWGAASAQIAETMQRIIDMGGKGKCEMMWVAYRDYTNKDANTKPIECSDWTSDPNVLVKFVKQIKCEANHDTEEAVELALEKVNGLEGVTCAILIGDAPPHKETKGNKIKLQKYIMHTDYKEEAAKLKAKGIPVYTFYMNRDPDLVSTFTEIATITGGRAEEFTNPTALKDVIAERALHSIGGDEMVVQYRKTYHS